VRLAAEAVLDQAGNKNSAGSVISVAYDYQKPRLTMRLAGGGSVGVIANTPGVPVSVEIESDETLAAELAAGDVSGRRALVAGASPSLFRIVTSKKRFAVGFFPGDPSPGLGQGNAMAVVAAGAVADLAGNVNARAEFTFAYDFVPPKPTMTLSDANATRSARRVMPFVLDFGEAVTVAPTGAAGGQVRVAFFEESATAADIAAAAATVWSGVTLHDSIAASSSTAGTDTGTIAPSGIAVARTGPNTFSINVTVPTATVGTLTRVAFHVQPGAAVDLAGHLSEAVPFDSVTHDSKAPVITFVTANNWQVTNANPVQFTFEVDEPVLGLSSADVEVYGGTLVPGSFAVLELAPTPVLMAESRGAGSSTGATAAPEMVIGTGVWGRRFTFSAAPTPSLRQGELTVEIRHRAARDQTGVDVAAAVRQTLAYDYVRPRVVLSEIKGTAAVIESLGGYKTSADVRRTLVVVEAVFDEVVENVDSTAAVVAGGLTGGGVVYSPAKVAPGMQVGNLTASAASTRWRFLVLLDAPSASVVLGEGAGRDLAGNPSMSAAAALSVPSNITLISGAGRSGASGGSRLALRVTALAGACALAVLRR